MTDASVFESSRARAEPMQPEPMIATSYVPSGFAAERAVAERRAGVPRCCEPPCTLNSLGQSASGTQYPPTYAPATRAHASGERAPIAQVAQGWVRGIGGGCVRAPFSPCTLPVVMRVAITGRLARACDGASARGTRSACEAEKTHASARLLALGVRIDQGASAMRNEV